jgi:hypothetical protein
MDAITIQSLFDDREGPYHWQMSGPERVAVRQLLELFKPDVVLEIGTYKGGSLNVLSAAARKVYSIDIDPSVAEMLRPTFPNVEFLTGDSATLVPQVLRHMEETGEAPGFVLIDGDHSREGIRRDIDNVLTHVPRQPMLILLHDSFNPDCRQGMLEANWCACPYVHYLEVDFRVGVFYVGEFATREAPSGTMWGGLALALLLPEQRAGELTIRRSGQTIFDSVSAQSVHAPRFSNARPERSDFVRRCLRWMKRTMVNRESRVA